MGVSLTDYKVLRVFDHDTYCNYLSCLALCDPHHLLLSFDSLTMHCRHGSIAFLHIGFCATHLRLRTWRYKISFMDIYNFVTHMYITLSTVGIVISSP